MKDYLTIGSVPLDEDCAQVGSDDYYQKSKIECRRFKEGLEKKFPNPPAGTYFRIKKFYHDFGEYTEVVVYFDDENEESMNFAFNVESNTPATWEELES